jgi:RNA methyltransferase, TrmH family
VGSFTSDQHADVKLLRRLLGRRSARLDEMLCVVEGPKVLAEAIRGGHRVNVVFVEGHGELGVVEEAVTRGAVLRRLAPGLLAKLGDTVSPQPVLAIVESPVLEIASLSPISAGLVVVGVDIADPGNAGTIVRSAELSGAVAVVFTGSSVDVTSPKVVRSSAGALFHIPVVQGADTIGVLQYLSTEGFRLLGTAVRGDSRSYTDAGLLTGSVAVVFGNEAHGLSDAAGESLDGWITIPTGGLTESLNVAMAASVICFEAARQRAASGSSDQ